MDSILELEQEDIKQIKKVLITDNKQLFTSSGPQIFEDCFNLLFCSGQGIKADNFNLIKSLSEQQDTSIAMGDIINSVLVICQ